MGSVGLTKGRGPKCCTSAEIINASVSLPSNALNAGNFVLYNIMAHFTSQGCKSIMFFSRWMLCHGEQSKAQVLLLQNGANSFVFVSIDIN
ncbi:hypothetical protein XELAEV_18003764mg [Xenopus laevis]|nr:hypothetical protein XELAEV_18003764mg [Xenopus laevis]